MRSYFLTTLILFVLLSLAGQLNAQACGESTRTIRLEYQKGSKAAASVEYELFYLMPKEEEDVRGDWHKHIAFLSKFMYGDDKAKDHMFWSRSDDGSTFLEVPKVKAEAYLKDYKLEDFKYLYTNDWRKYHLSHLKGKFVGDKLEFHTGETDGTTFLMKLTAAGYETQYLLNDFMGGCHYNYAVRNGPPFAQKIVMRKAGKS